ncbi:MAG TPA: DUF1127 domain-containing protein [Xanthobacteraceae bacterium]|nr:DUF1127 domain-containing protein [Xanthobacteraceae bacterium]
MSALTTPAVPAILTQAVAALGATARRVCRQLVEAWRRRKDAAVLASFDDYMLRDIGLTRGDLNDALAELPWRDPTAVLVRRQRERRAHRCRIAPPAALLHAGPSIVPDAGPAGCSRDRLPRTT